LFLCLLPSFVSLFEKWNMRQKPRFVECFKCGNEKKEE